MKYINIDWESIKMDMKERFLNYESAKGVYYVTVFGGGLLFFSLFYEQYMLKFVGIFGGVFFLSEGLRKILVNRIKKSVKEKQLIEERMKKNDGTAA